MAMIFEVCQQCIHLSEPVRLVSGTIGEYTAQFIFCSGWDDYAKIAVFKPSRGEMFEQLLEGDTVAIPDEVLMNPGYLQVGVYGVNGGSVKPTVWSTPITVVRGTDTTGLINPTPSVVEQLLNLLKGGLQGMHFAKNSDADFDISWVVPPEELPPVTAEDNGKVLAVVNGLWAVKELYSEVENSAGGISAIINTL